MKTAVVLILIVICMASCARPKDLVYRNVQHFNMQQSAVSMDVKLYNPNNYKMKLKHADLDIFLNGSHLGKVATKATYSISRLDTFTLPVLLAVDYKNVLPNIIQLIFNSEVDVKLTGKVKAGRHGVFVTIPINYSGKQDIQSGVKL